MSLSSGKQNHRSLLWGLDWKILKSGWHSKFWRYVVSEVKFLFLFTVSQALQASDKSLSQELMEENSSYLVNSMLLFKTDIPAQPDAITFSLMYLGIYLFHHFFSSQIWAFQWNSEMIFWGKKNKSFSVLKLWPVDRNIFFLLVLMYRNITSGLHCACAFYLGKVVWQHIFQEELF